MLQFELGDKAVYPAQGVVEVLGIEKKEISGKIHKFYCLQIMGSDMKILVPIDKAEQVGLRKVIEVMHIQDVYEIIREKEIYIDKQTWNRRYRGFMEKIKTGSLFEVAEVFRDLFRLKTHKTLSFGERRMLDMAKSLIVKELSIVKAITEKEMEEELDKLCAE